MKYREALNRPRLKLSDNICTRVKSVKNVCQDAAISVGKQSKNGQVGALRKTQNSYRGNIDILDSFSFLKENQYAKYTDTRVPAVIRWKWWIIEELKQ